MTMLPKREKGLTQPAADKRREPEVQRRGNQAWGIAGLRQVEAQLLVDKIHHALGRRRLAHIPLLPGEALKALLKLHHFQGLRMEN